MTAKKAPRKKACDCIARMNKALSIRSTELNTVFSLTGGPPRVVVHTLPILDENGKKPRRYQPPLALAIFCPFCGASYK